MNIFENESSILGSTSVDNLKQSFKELFRQARVIGFYTHIDRSNWSQDQAPYELRLNYFDNYYIIKHEIVMKN